jgi:3-hydroxyanthranilate 3,4-dioxygenase
MALNLQQYISDNKALLVPPVCNKMIHNDGDLRVMVVGGPNRRKDYHINQGAELFYQIQGRMCLKVMERGAPKDVVIEEGEFFMLPACVPHSPQRFEDTVGLVIERRRPASELDGLRYHVDDSNAAVLWERYFHVTDLGKQLVPLITEYFASDEFTTRVPAPMPAAPIALDTETVLPAPFALAGRLAAAQTSTLAEKAGEFTAAIVAGGAAAPAVGRECWLWQLAGASEVNGVALATGDTLLAAAGVTSWANDDAASRVMLVYTTHF